MRKTLITVILGAGLALWSQQPARPPDGAIFSQAIGRVSFNADGSAELYGYFTLIEGVNQPLFEGAQSERNAHFTYRTDPSGLDYIHNGTIMHLFGRPRQGAAATVRVYYDPDPDQDLDKPETFGNGQVLATYEIRGTRATVIPASIWTASTLLVRQTAAEGAAFEVPERLTVHLSGLSLASFDQFQLSRAAGALRLPFGASIHSSSSR